MSNHAFLSASSSHRWLECPPSAKLCAEHEDRASPYAKQGTDYHELCAYLVEKALGKDVKDPTENLDYYDTEMWDCAESYCPYVLEQIEEAKKYCSDPQVLIEQKLDFSRWVENGFGTGDCVIVADGVLHICDYKHGIGILVSAELLKWAEGVLAPTAKLAYAGEGEFKAGEHCQFCKVKAACRKRAEYNLDLARYDFEMLPVLDDTEISAILGKIDSLVSWASDIKEYALQQALSGVRYNGFKVVEGRANRKYSDEAVVAAAVAEAGYDPYEKKVLGITAMTSLLGRKKFEEVVGSYIIKPQGKPALVPESDKRPAMNTAYEDFSEN